VLITLYLATLNWQQLIINKQPVFLLRILSLCFNTWRDFTSEYLRVSLGDAPGYLVLIPRLVKEVSTCPLRFSI